MKNSVLLIALFAVVQATFALAHDPVPEDRRDATGFQWVTVEQLEQIIATAKSQSDRTLAKRIGLLQLKERLDGNALQRCENDVRGRRAKEALMVVADKSAFLPPPAAEIPSLAEPDTAGQRAMIALMQQYVTKTLHQLPDFYATRITTTFGLDLSRAGLKPVGTYRVIVHYSNGKEVVRLEKGPLENRDLTNRGLFGPILAMAMLDSVRGNLAWSRWEQGATNLEAVFSYSVTASTSHYEVNGRMRGYSGDIAIDPSSGAILRLVVQTGMDQNATIELVGLNTEIANVEVEYGPVDLGGKTYICPLRSVTLVERMDSTWLNDVVFKQYHLFRGEHRILPGFTPVQ